MSPAISAQRIKEAGNLCILQVSSFGYLYILSIHTKMFFNLSGKQKTRHEKKRCTKIVEFYIDNSAVYYHYLKAYGLKFGHFITL